jgi:hypothetical protein
VGFAGCGTQQKEIGSLCFGLIVEDDGDLLLRKDEAERPEAGPT